jgi:hypothetical protein
MLLMDGHQASEFLVKQLGYYEQLVSSLAEYDAGNTSMQVRNLLHPIGCYKHQGPKLETWSYKFCHFITSPRLSVMFPMQQSFDEFGVKKFP